MGQRKKKFSSYSFIFAFLLTFVGAMFASGGLFVSKSNQIAQQAPAADAVSYMAWDDASKTVKSVEGGCTEYTVVTDSTTSWSTGWYVVNSEVEINNRISVSGTANLILCDGATLTANDGISVNNGNTLYIYGQSEGTGSIIATAKSNRIAGIGGNGDTACGTIFIHGGTITATGPNKTPGAGIGGGNGGDGGNITIYGGNITANGGKYSAAIGGGYTSGAGTITIYGGNIDANGGPQGAGLGCAADMGTNHPGGTITIHGGIINATGGVYAAGIGGSLDDPAVTITINGGDITAIGGANAAGIGGGYCSSVGTVTINDGKVFATGGGNGAYGIGNGSEATNDGTLIVSNNDLNVLGNDSETPIFPRDAKTATEYQFHGWKYMTVTSAANVTFNTNDGTINSGDFNVYGEGIITPLPTNVTKTDYVFGGWYTDSALTEGPVTEISADSRGALEYWAKWKESIPYYAWDEESKTVKAVPGGCSEYTTITDSTTYWSNGWYVVNSEVEINNRISVSGTANLILCDGANLTANGGISVIEGNTLNIYAQSEGENTGKIEAVINTEDFNNAVIGGDEYEDAGTINIHGGNIKANNGKYSVCAAIGGGSYGASGYITIYGGNITANGSYGAGIGGGVDGNGGSITIYGGTINTTSRAGAAIGGGYNGEGGTITIYGGNITAVSTEDGAGIGGGENASGGNITIHDGVVIAKGYCGAAIGGGSEGAGGTITINGGTVTATNLRNAAGIGGGQVASGGTINITGGTVYATGGAGAAGIGGGDFGNYGGTGGNVTISGGTIYATGGSESVGIGAGKNSTEHGSLVINETSFVVYGDNDKNPPTTEREKSGSAGYDTVRWKYMIVGLPHEHSWSYSANGKTITATCENPGCGITEGLELTIEAPDGNLIYDGTAKTASLVSGYSIVAFSGPTPTIEYYKNDTSVDSCVDAGTYEAKVTYGGATAVLEFTIDQATPDIPTGLVATYGDNLSSVTLPSDWAWKNPNDKVGNAGNREHNAIYTSTDPNYKSVEKTITVSVSQATPTPEVPTGLVATYGDKLSSVVLPTNWSWKVLTDEVGDVGDRTHVAIYTPTDSNYKAIEANIIISVAQATPNPDIPTGLEATYGDKLSSVILPSGWAWKNPEDSVGNAGESIHVATFTPTDPNYKAVEEVLTINVKTADPDPVGTLDATFGQKLADITLPNGWAWADGTQSVGDVGSHDFAAHYTAVDTNHHDKDASITVSVSQAIPTPDIPTGIVATYGDKLSSVALPTNWSWKVPTDEVGDVGDRTHVAIYTPTDTNYKAIEANIIISVAQATPTPEVPTDLEATYGDKLSSVILPSGWAWKNPEDSVGDAGERVHVATFTPTDPNYKAKDENITIIVAKANPSYTLPTDIEIYINEIVSSVTLPSGFSWMDESIKASSLGENTFKVRYTPVDTANYNVVDNIDLKVNVEWKVVDPSSSSASIEINDADEAYTTDISVKVEVKTDISVEQKRNEYASLATNDFVKSNEDIVEIYNVKLIRTTNGVEEEIQPSDIKTGTKITVSMAIPQNLIGKEFRLIHIHNAEDISEITNYSVSKDGKTLAVEIDRLSEFAFIGATDKDNGFIYNSTPIWALILLIIFSIILLVGIYYLYRLIKDRNDNSNNKDKSVKTMSVTFISPILLAYSGLNGIIIAFIIVAALAVIVWASNLCLFISKKKKKEKLIDANNSIKNKEDLKPVEEAINDSNEDEIEVVTIKDEKGNIFNIRYIKSFLAKLIQSPAETKSYYEELKNEVLSYKGTHSRISWHFDSVNAGRNYVLKFAIRGKTLCLYLPLDADSFIDTKYKVEKVEAKKYQDVPCLYRIKNDRRLRYAKELIATVASNLGLSKGEEQHEIYSNLPYEENKPLIARGLIKEQRVQVNKPKEEVVETKVNAEGDEIVITKDNKGNMFEIRYVKSFTAKLSQSPDETKGYYSDLKNYVLSYKGPHSRVSWHHDAINLGRDYIIKFAIRGKTLCVYFALDISKLESKYKVEEAKGKRFEEVPCLYRIKNDRRFKYAKELIDMLMNNLGIQRGKELNDEYRIPYEETKVLLAKGLIKEVKTKVTPKEVMESVSAEEADKLMSDVKAEASIEEDVIHHRRQGLKDIINIDTLSQNYNDGDEVTLDSLIEKKLISPKVGYVKVLGRGVLDKKLIVILNDYSPQAVKMIVLTGGHVKKINN